MLWVACCLAAALLWRFGHQGLTAFNHDTADIAAGLGVVTATSVGVVLAGRSLTRAAQATVAFRQQVRSRTVPLPPQVSAAARATGLVGQVEMITSPVAFALTYGLAWPRVLVSSALAQALQPHEVRAVLTHEAEHVRGHDPLRTLILRMVTARLFYLPILGQLRQRFTLIRELAADHRDRATCGIATLVGALLKITDGLAWTRPAPAAAMGTETMLRTRVAHLEDRPERPAKPSTWRLTLTLAGGGVLTWALVGSALLIAHTSLPCMQPHPNYYVNVVSTTLT
jgi:hypothetical protein